MDEQAGLQVIICSGPEDARRAALGFATALAARASGVQVTIFLVLDGARWALLSEGNEPVPGFQSVAQLLEAIVDAGGRIEVCSNCMEGACGPLPGNKYGSTMRPGVVFGGLSSVAIRMVQNPTVTF